jgi:hypothetical protein
MRKVFGAFLILIALSVMWDSINGFDNAKNWIAIFINLFWMIISLSCLDAGVEKWKK